MRVVEVETQDRKTRYVVIDEEGKLVGPIVHYLKYLDRIGSARLSICPLAQTPFWLSQSSSSSSGRASSF